MSKPDMNSEKRSQRQRPPAPRPSPWLLFPYKKAGGKREHAFVSISEPQQTFLKRITEVSGKNILASFHGWLFLEEDKHDPCTLFNPVSLETIRLPFLKSTKIKKFNYCAMSSPLSDPNCTVFIINNASRTICFWQPGDQEWTEQEYRKELEKITGEEYMDSSILCVAGFEGKLYAETTGDPKLVVFEVDGEKNRLKISFIRVRLRHFARPYTLRGQSYLMESFGELFHVEMGYREPFDPKEVRKIEVWRFDFSQEGWIRVESLKDRAIFLGPDCSTSCYATEPGIKGNTVYFCAHGDKSLYAYDLEEWCVSVSDPCPKLPTTWFEPVWVMPDLRITDMQRGEQGCHAEACEGDVDKEITGHDYEVKDLKEKQEVEESLWDNLPLDVLALVAKHLTPLDFMQFRAVCRRFKSVAPLTNWRTANLGTQTSPPFLVSFKPGSGIYNFTDSVHGDTYFMKIPELLLDATICHSKDGWFLLSELMESIDFFNPFTKEIKEYPPLDGPFSCATVATYSDSALVAITKPTLEGIRIFFRRPGEEDWSHAEEETDFIPNSSSVIYDGAFYFLGFHGNLGVFKLGEDTHKWEEVAKSPCNSFESSFLVECDGDLLSVFVGRSGRWVQVFRLNLSEMIWVKVESLGNYMLFVSSNSSTFSMVASSPEMHNRIYFPRFCKKSIVFYSLETKKFHSLGREDSMDDFCGTREPKECAWIQPCWL